MCSSVVNGVGQITAIFRQQKVKRYFGVSKNHVPKKKVAPHPKNDDCVIAGLVGGYTSFGNTETLSDSTGALYLR